MQGYYYSKPLAPDQFEAFVRRTSAVERAFEVPSSRQ
jgi:EAL domain-containing protein (putative c-di-GMP-specific phosphodiesterase class I)